MWKIGFFGTPEVAVPFLRAVSAAHEVSFVVTQPDKRRSRRGAEVGSPVKGAAKDLGLEAMTPNKAGDIVGDVAASQIDVGVVVAYGKLLPTRLLDVPKYGFVNVHFSLLPRWRGAAPVQRALLAGDETTGVSIMKLVRELDAGPVLASEPVAIGDNDTTDSMFNKLTCVGAPLLLHALETLGSNLGQDQTGEASYAEMLQADEFRIDWNASARRIDRVVRAGFSKPGAWTTSNGVRLKVLVARICDDAPMGLAPGQVVGDVVGTGEGAISLVTVQPAGKKPMEARAWLAGHDVVCLGD